MKSSVGAGSGNWVTTVALPNDAGDDITVTGRLVAEDMHFNNVNGMLTVEKIYQAEEGYTAYSVISAIGHTRDRRAYRIEESGEECTISNGRFALEVPTDSLLELLSVAIESERDAFGDASCEHMIRRLAAND